MEDDDEENILKFMSYGRAPEKRGRNKQAEEEEEPAILWDKDEVVSQQRKVDIVNEIKRKEKTDMGLEKPIQRSGFMKYQNYEDKLKMMDTALFLFGMKLHN